MNDIDNDRLNRGVARVRKYLTQPERVVARELCKLFLVAGRCERLVASELRRSSLHIVDDGVDLSRIKGLSASDMAAIKKIRTLKRWMDERSWRLVEMLFDNLRTRSNRPPGFREMGATVVIGYNDDDEAAGDVDWPLLNSPAGQRAVAIGSIRATIWYASRLLRTYAYGMERERIADGNSKALAHYNPVSAVRAAKAMMRAIGP